MASLFPGHRRSVELMCVSLPHACCHSLSCLDTQLCSSTPRASRSGVLTASQNEPDWETEPLVPTQTQAIASGGAIRTGYLPAGQAGQRGMGRGEACAGDFFPFNSWRQVLASNTHKCRRKRWRERGRHLLAMQPASPMASERGENCFFLGPL